MNNKPTEPTEIKRFSMQTIMLALISAFLPSVIVLVMFTFFKGRNVPTVVLIGECAFCLVCCAAPSIVLFRRHPVLAIVFGILMVPLNAAISLFFGCTAMLSYMRH